MKLTKRKSLIALAVLCLAAVPAVALGSGTKKSADPVQLNYWDMQWGGPALMNQIQKNVALFNETHPGIQVKFTQLSWGDYMQKILAAVQAGTPPDVGGGDSGLSVLDFSLFSTFRDNIRNGNFGGIGGVLGFDWLYGDATQLVTFFQNHDVGPDNDFKFRFGGEAWKAAIAYNLLWTIRGIPCLYQGEEIQFMPGAPEDIDGPSMTLDQTGRAYFGDHLLPGMRGVSGLSCGAGDVTNLQLHAFTEAGALASIEISGTLGNVFHTKAHAHVGVGLAGRQHGQRGISRDGLGCYRVAGRFAANDRWLVFGRRAIGSCLLGRD